jgi:hypothetical protein
LKYRGIGKSKILYGPPSEEEWVKVRAFMNSKFPAESPCSMCQGISCGMVWFSIKNKEVRCVKCFTPAEPATKLSELATPLEARFW